MAKDEYRQAKAEARAARKAISAEAKAVRDAAKLAVQAKLTEATKRVADAVVGPEPPWWQSRSPQRNRAAPLSREAIVDAAIRVLDGEGADALTIRRLAAELDTGPATLYWHIGGKDELGELVYDRLVGQVRLPPPDPAHWVEQLKEVARDSYRVMRAHNDAVKLSVGQVPFGPNGLRMIEWTLGLLRSAGVPDGVAGYFGDLLGRYVDASVLEDTARPTLAGRSATPEDAAALLRGYFSSLPAEQFPNLTAVVDSVVAGSGEERFEMGLDILLRGLAAYVDRPPAG